jgi:predicted Fe-S protein YdhL (DUF1289 family)
MERMIVSPCIGLCRIDEQSDLCVGCARTRTEIAIWREATPERRRQIWLELPVRRQKLGLNMHRLDWDLKDVRSFILDTLRPGGVWTSGVAGAVAEFCIGEEETYRVEAEPDAIRALSPRGAISFRLGDHIRALRFDSPSGDDIVVLAAPRGKAGAFEGPGLVRLGPDRDATREEDRDKILYDFGLGRRTAGFGVRTGHRDLIARLDRAVGLDLRQLPPSVGADIQQASPTRVVRSAIGRIEIYTNIPHPGSEAPAGPHTRFQPAVLAGGSDAPAGVDLPEAYVACAIYYPAYGGPNCGNRVSQERIAPGRDRR